MKALTILQPYAHLICLPETDPRHKRVENRNWSTKYRGPLAIHAGKSRRWLDSFYDLSMKEVTFGAVVAVVNLVDSIPVSRIENGSLEPDKLWLRRHQHSEGPWCWVLANVKRLEKPIPWRGAQGLFEIPDEVLR